MPLSEEEQKILQQMEHEFTRDDPDLARDMSTASGYSLALRNMKLAGGGFLAGLVLLVSMIESLPIAFVGVVIMTASAFIFARDAKHVGKAGVDQVARNIPNANALFGEAGKKMKDRMRREDD